MREVKISILVNSADFVYYSVVALELQSELIPETKRVSFWQSLLSLSGG
jgi:hypothetical protein